MGGAKVETWPRAFSAPNRHPLRRKTLERRIAHVQHHRARARRPPERPLAKPQRLKHRQARRLDHQSRPEGLGGREALIDGDLMAIPGQQQRRRHPRRLASRHRDLQRLIPTLHDARKVAVRRPLAQSCPTALLFITHPEVVVDSAVPVPNCGLSDKGRARMAAFAAPDTTANVKAVWSSGAAKALKAAAILAGHLGLTLRVDEAPHENDRSATGFLPPDQFENLADAFFASPQDSVRGWERAIDAQGRVVAVLERCLAAAPSEGDVAVVAPRRRRNPGPLPLSGRGHRPVLRPALPGPLLDLGRRPGSAPVEEHRGAVG